MGAHNVAAGSPAVGRSSALCCQLTPVAEAVRSKT